MISLYALWLPILVSAVIVFVASSLIHMVLPWHKGDYPPVPEEEKILDALRPFGIPPGDYLLPRPKPGEMRDPAFVEKLNRGPVLLMTVWKNGGMNMGSNLAQWFVFSLVISVFSAYLTGRAVPPGTDYLQVFRFAGTVAFMGYSVALAELSIWYQRSWALTIKGMVDGLIYGCLTGGTFGWLWPR